MSFCEFSSLRSIGFSDSNLRNEASSTLVFLSLNTKNLEIHMNLLMIDPYLSKTQIAIFKSTKTFSKDMDDIQSHDQVIKTVIFSTHRSEKDKLFDVKCLT